MFFRPILSLCFLAGLCAWLAAGEEPALFGPAANRAASAFSAGQRFSAISPLVSGEVSTNGGWWAVSPLFSRFEERDTERVHWEFLYPLMTSDRFGTEHRWQLLQWLSWSGGETQNGSRKSRQTIFPLFFRQQADGSTNDYLAVVPFYGRLQNRLFRDEMRFILFPLYLESSKDGIHTRNYLLPFIHLRSGSGVEGWQFWPLVGREDKVPTQLTNTWDEIELVGGHQKRFLLWPLAFSTKSGLGTTNAATNRMVLPLFARQRSPARDSTTVIWPFFTHTDNRQLGFQEWGLPWPFIGWADGSGKTMRRFWPVWGATRTPSQERDFAFWPLYTHRHIRSAPLESERWRGLWFLYDHSYDRSTETGAERRRRDLWPLFSWRRDFEGRERLQVLAPLETLIKNNEAIERTYSPVWSLYRSEENPRAGRLSQSLLWSLWSREVSTNASHSGAFFGLVRTRRDDHGRQWRFFWLPFSKQESSGAGTPASTGLLNLPERRGDFVTKRLKPEPASVASR